MLRPIVAAFATLTLAVTTAGAQTTSRWALAWTDDSYRVVDGKRVPVGEQTAVLSITPTRGDSVIATLPTANAAIVDTLYGTMIAQRLELESRVRGADARSPSDAASGGFSFSMRIELTFDGDRATGRLQRRIVGPPGMTVLPPEPTPLTAQRIQ